MDWHAIVGIVAGLLQIVTIGFYVKEMIRGTTRPNLVSWSLWTFATSILLVAQIAAGPSWSLVLPIATTSVEFVVVVLGFWKYGYKKFGITDGACLVFSLSALGFWYLTSNPVIAIVFAVLSDGTAYIPTFIKTYKEPHSEAAYTWFMSASVGFLSAMASSKYNVANLAFPIYYLVINLVVWALAFFGQRLKNPL